MNDDLPPFVTFTTGAKLLVDEGLVDEITAEGLRYHARKNPPWWKFGDRPDQLPYIRAGRARTMETGAFLDMFKDGPRRGGIGNKPQPPKPDEEPPKS